MSSHRSYDRLVTRCMGFILAGTVLSCAALALTLLS